MMEATTTSSPVAVEVATTTLRMRRRSGTSSTNGCPQSTGHNRRNTSRTTYKYWVERRKEEHVIDAIRTGMGRATGKTKDGNIRRASPTTKTTTERRSFRLRNLIQRRPLGGGSSTTTPTTMVPLPPPMDPYGSSGGSSFTMTMEHVNTVYFDTPKLALYKRLARDNVQGGEMGYVDHDTIDDDDDDAFPILRKNEKSYCKQLFRIREYGEQLNVAVLELKQYKRQGNGNGNDGHRGHNVGDRVVSENADRIILDDADHPVSNKERVTILESDIASFLSTEASPLWDYVRAERAVRDVNAIISGVVVTENKATTKSMTTTTSSSTPPAAHWNQLRNPTGEDTDATVRMLLRIQRMIRRLDLKPCLRTRYSRLAFQHRPRAQDQRPSLRVTLDWDLEFALPDDDKVREKVVGFGEVKPSAVQFPFSILEIKLTCENDDGGSNTIVALPNFLMKLVRDGSIHEVPKFSKYMTGVAMLLLTTNKQAKIACNISTTRPPPQPYWMKYLLLPDAPDEEQDEAKVKVQQLMSKL